MLVSIDIETTDLHFKKAKLIGLGYCKQEHPGHYDTQYINHIPNTPIPKHWIQVYHNGKFDLKVGKEVGIKGMRLDHDTLVMASLLRPDMIGATEYKGLGLEDLAKALLNIDPWKPKKDLDLYTPDDWEKRCRQDCIVTQKLFESLMTSLVDQDLWCYYHDWLMPTVRFLTEVESKGVCVDISKLQHLRSVYERGTVRFEEAFRSVFNKEIRPIEETLLEKKLSKYKTEKKITEVFNDPPRFNIRSAEQIKALLSSQGIIALNKDEEETTSSRAIKYYSGGNKLVQAILAYRDKKQQKQFYVSWDDLLVDGKLYTNYNVHRVRTGRLSSNKPNLQQIDKRRRYLFKASPGKVFVIVDYSQIEPRLAAHFSEDRKLINVYKNKHDLYGTLAVDVLKCPCKPEEVKEKFPKERQIAKTLLLGVLYGMGKKALSFTLTTELGIPTTEQEAKRYISTFWAMYPGLEKYKWRCVAEANKFGYIKGWFGRKLWISKEDAQHKPLNTKIQNAASELTVQALLNVQHEIADNANLILLTHDEGVFETIPESVESLKTVIQKHMVDAFETTINVPLEVEIGVGDTWAAKK